MMDPRLSFLAFLLLCACAAPPDAAPQPAQPEWIPLFNGQDLTGWQPKFSGHPLGENFNDTFRVDDGVLRVTYDRYQSFDRKFGHLFFERPFSRYRLRVEYRFVGDQVSGGPGWAFRNNGLMLHCQPPPTMAVDQDFPNSIEVQLLGGRETGERHTANLCTPGTHVVMNGELVTRHCTDSTSKTYRGDQWVTVEVEVVGNLRIRHIIDGETVLEYTAPQLDDGSHLDNGYIAIQAESHPTEFRRIEILDITDR